MDVDINDKRKYDIYSNQKTAMDVDITVQHRYDIVNSWFVELLMKMSYL